MEDRNGALRDFFRIGTPQCGILMGLFGVAVAFLLIYAGFWNTLLIVLFFAAGYAFGSFSNKTESIKKLINRLFPPKGE